MEGFCVGLTAAAMGLFIVYRTMQDREKGKIDSENFRTKIAARFFFRYLLLGAAVLYAMGDFLMLFGTAVGFLLINKVYIFKNLLFGKGGRRFVS